MKGAPSNFTDTHRHRLSDLLLNGGGGSAQSPGNGHLARAKRKGQKQQQQQQFHQGRQAPTSPGKGKKKTQFRVLSQVCNGDKEKKRLR